MMSCESPITSPFSNVTYGILPLGALRMSAAAQSYESPLNFRYVSSFTANGDKFGVPQGRVGD